MLIKYKQALLNGAIVFMTFLAPQSQAYILDLQDASPYNAVIFGNMEASRSDTEGRLAVGGNLTLDNYAVGLKLAPSGDRYDTLTVGGELNFIDGHIYNGNARSGTQATLTNVGFTGGEYIIGNPLDFAALEQQAQTISADWSVLTNNTSTSLTNNQLHLFGNNTELNIFSIAATDLDILTSEFILEIPDNSWALINVIGTAVTIADLGFFRITSDGTKENIGDRHGHDGSLTQTVLFNFFEADNLEIHNAGVAGSILAPFAATTFYDGHIDGQLITYSLQGQTGEPSGQINYYPLLSYELQSANQVPAPNILLLFSLGSLLFFRFKIAAQK